jgi:hypothetical protein
MTYRDIALEVPRPAETGPLPVGASIGRIGGSRHGKAAAADTTQAIGPPRSGNSWRRREVSDVGYLALPIAAARATRPSRKRGEQAIGGVPQGSAGPRLHFISLIWNRPRPPPVGKVQIPRLRCASLGMTGEALASSRPRAFESSRLRVIRSCPDPFSSSGVGRSRWTAREAKAPGVPQPWMLERHRGGVGISPLHRRCPPSGTGSTRPTG